jgi:hypothetical protein
VRVASTPENKYQVGWEATVAISFLADISSIFFSFIFCLPGPGDQFLPL